MNEGNDADLERYFGAGKESEELLIIKLEMSRCGVLGKFTRCDDRAFP